MLSLEEFLGSVWIFQSWSSLGEDLQMEQKMLVTPTEEEF